MAHAAIEVLSRALILSDNHILLCAPAHRNYRYLPGGHVERDESAIAALERELAEELGSDSCSVGRLVLTMEQRFVQKGKPRHEITLMFHVEHLRAGGRPVRSSTPVESLESKLVFDWWPIERIAEARILPRQLASWLIQFASGGGTNWLAIAESDGQAGGD